MTDILIVGGGPAGLTAAIYATRAGLSVDVAERQFAGGQMTVTMDIDNYPGLPKTTGAELSQRMEKQAGDLGAQILYREVTALTLTPGALSATTPQGIIPARGMILAMGATRRKLGIPGEEEFAGRGVSYCATCDGGFFKGADVAVVGGGNTALEEALFLSAVCRRVTLIHRRDAFRGNLVLVEALRKTPNVDFMLDCVPVAVEGARKVENVRVRGTKTGKIDHLPVSGFFVAVGTKPESAMLRGVLNLDAEGRVLAGEDGRTDIAGVFVAGDLRKKTSYQIVTACADGASAAGACTMFLLG